MTSVQGYGCFYKKYLSVTPLDFFPSYELDNKFSEQPTRHPKPHFCDIIVLATIFFVLKYIKENIQQIFQTVLGVWVSITSEKSQDKSLKAWSLDVYRNKSYIKRYNFFQQCEDYFTTTGAKGFNEIFFAIFFF